MADCIGGVPGTIFAGGEPDNTTIVMVPPTKFTFTITSDSPRTHGDYAYPTETETRVIKHLNFTPTLIMCGYQVPPNNFFATVTLVDANLKSGFEILRSSSSYDYNATGYFRVNDNNDLVIYVECLSTGGTLPKTRDMNSIGCIVAVQ